MSTFDERNVVRRPGGGSDGRGGQFAEKPQSAPEVALGEVDLSTWTPVEIDTDTARMMPKLWAADLKARRTVESIRYLLGKGRYDTFDALTEPLPERLSYNERRLALEREQLIEDRRVYNEILDHINRNEGEYARRPWPRVFLVPQGHAHSSTACSTCYPTTVFYLLPEYSDKTEDEIVQAAGSRACTVCYPSAPVDVLGRPSEMLTPDERDSIAAREERAKAKAERDAKKAAKGITAPDGQPLIYTINWASGYVQRNRIETEYSAWQELTKLEEYYGDAMRAGKWAHDNGNRGDLNEYINARDLIAEALMHKTGKTREEVDAEVQRRVKNRAKRG